jgi:hypothetical protein
MRRTKTTLTKWMDEKRRRFLEEEGWRQAGPDLAERVGDEDDAASMAAVTSRALDLQWKLLKSTR